MTDGNNRREGLASANTIEPADRDNSVGFSLTRRSFMAAGGATAVASAKCARGRKGRLELVA